MTSVIDGVYDCDKDLGHFNLIDPGTPGHPSRASAWLQLCFCVICLTVWYLSVFWLTARVGGSLDHFDWLIPFPFFLELSFLFTYSHIGLSLVVFSPFSCSKFIPVSVVNQTTCHTQRMMRKMSLCALSEWLVTASCMLLIEARLCDFQMVHMNDTWVIPRS